MKEIKCIIKQRDNGNKPHKLYCRGRCFITSRSNFISARSLSSVSKNKQQFKNKKDFFSEVGGFVSYFLDFFLPPTFERNSYFTLFCVCFSFFKKGLLKHYDVKQYIDIRLQQLRLICCRLLKSALDFSKIPT